MTNNHFIIGIWRSGTSLMREILGMSELAFTFPEHFILLNNLKLSKDFKAKSKNILYQRIASNPDFIHFAKPNLAEFENELKSSETFSDAILAAYQSCVPEKDQPKVFIDKNPIYSYYLEELIRLFPASKFIWMLREPKDNCISRSKHEIQSYKNYGYLAAWWNLTNYEIAKHARINPDKFLLVHYDDFVNSPESHIRNICDFIDIDFDSSMLSFEKKKEQRLNDFIIAAKSRNSKLSHTYIQKKTAMWENLQKPINNSKTKQWRSDMSEEEQKHVDNISLSYYKQLLENNFKTTPKYSYWEPLVKLSLAKLKWDISRLKKV